MISTLEKIEFFGIHADEPKTRVFRSLGDCVAFIKKLHAKGMKHARMREVMYGNDKRDRRFIVKY